MLRPFAAASLYFTGISHCDGPTMKLAASPMSANVGSGGATSSATKRAFTFLSFSAFANALPSTRCPPPTIASGAAATIWFMNGAKSLVPVSYCWFTTTWRPLLSAYGFAAATTETENESFSFTIATFLIVGSSFSIASIAPVRYFDAGVYTWYTFVKFCSIVASSAPPAVTMTLPFCSDTSAAVFTRPDEYGDSRKSTLSSLMSFVYSCWTRSVADPSS